MTYQARNQVSIYFTSRTFFSDTWRGIRGQIAPNSREPPLPVYRAFHNSRKVFESFSLIDSRVIGWLDLNSWIFCNKEKVVTLVKSCFLNRYIAKEYLALYNRFCWEQMLYKTVWLFLSVWVEKDNFTLHI